MEKNISELIKELPEEIQGMVTECLPVLSDMAMFEIAEWIRLIVNGKEVAALRMLAVKMDSPVLIKDIDELNAETDVVNEANAAAMAKRKAMLTNVALGMVTVGVGYVARYLPTASPATTPEPTPEPS